MRSAASRNWFANRASRTMAFHKYSIMRVFLTKASPGPEPLKGVCRRDEWPSASSYVAARQFERFVDNRMIVGNQYPHSSHVDVSSVRQGPRRPALSTGSVMWGQLSKMLGFP